MLSPHRVHMHLPHGFNDNQEDADGPGQALSGAVQAASTNPCSACTSLLSSTLGLRCHPCAKVKKASPQQDLGRCCMCSYCMSSYCWLRRTQGQVPLQPAHLLVPHQGPSMIVTYQAAHQHMYVCVPLTSEPRHEYALLRSNGCHSVTAQPRLINDAP